MKSSSRRSLNRHIGAISAVIGIAIGVALGVIATPALAAFPEKPVKIVVPFPPGGSVDVLGRLIAQRMQENWGQSVIVETRPGASTMIGTASVAKAEPDGSMIAIQNASLFAITPLAVSPDEATKIDDLEIVQGVYRDD